MPAAMGSTSKAPRRAQRRRRGAPPAAWLAGLAALGALARQGWSSRAQASVPAATSAAAPRTLAAPEQRPRRVERRDALVAAGLPGLLAGSIAGPVPAHAIFGFFEKPWRDYTVLDAFNISMPPEYNLTKRDPPLLIWQGDRIQPLEQMFASAKTVTYPDLATALKGQNITEIGLGLAAKRKAGAAQLVEVKRDPTEAGLDVWLFDFEGEKLHELVLYALVQRGPDRILCNLVLRTPRILWESRRDTFNKIASSFSPLDPQPNRTSGFVADNVALQSLYEVASVGNLQANASGAVFDIPASSLPPSL